MDAYMLSQQSGELKDNVGLYTLGRDVELRLNIKEIQKLRKSGKLTPEDVNVAKALYSDCHARRKGNLPPGGHVYSNLVILEPNATIPGTRKPGEGYIVGHFFEHTNGYDLNGNVRETDDTRETTLWLPPLGFVVPTRYGTNNRLGLADETIPETEENVEIAKQRLAEADLPESELMTFIRGNDGRVVVWSVSSRFEGPLCIYLCQWSSRESLWRGSFPPRRSPSDGMGDTYSPQIPPEEAIV